MAHREITLPFGWYYWTVPSSSSQIILSAQSLTGKTLKIPELNGKFNLILQMKLRRGNNYTEYNEAILRGTEETVMAVVSKCQGWYYHSWDTLTPILDARNKVLYNIRANKLAPSGQTLSKLRKLQWEVNEVIAMAKTRWSRHLEEVIHNMSFQSKESWVNVCILRKG